MKDRKRTIAARLLVVVMALIAFAGGFAASGGLDVEAASPVSVTATAKVAPSEGAIMRKSTSTSSAKVCGLDKGTVVTVKKEIFKTKKSTSTTNRWYYVSYGSKTGYMRADVLGSFSYNVKQGKTTKKIAYRIGAGASMKKKGTIKKGAKVNIVMRAGAKGSKTLWYKVKIGSKYYFVSSKYVTEVQSSSAASEVKLEAKEIKINYGNEDEDGVNIEETDVEYPERIGKGHGFSLKGKLASNVEMSKVLFGVTNTDGKWLISVYKDVNAKTFNISNVDKDIKFGILPYGTYYYKGIAFIGDKGYLEISQKFQIVKPTGADKIAATAIALAWPKGTSSSKYKYKKGAPTAKYKAALNEVYPNRSKWSAAPKVGASCDVFVGTAIRKSGYDTVMPRGLGNTKHGQWYWLNKSNKWERVPYNYKESDLQNGDVIIYQRYSGSEHICIYVKISGKGYLAEAAIKKYYGHLSRIKSSSKIFKKSDKRKLYVYRATS